MVNEGKVGEHLHSELVALCQRVTELEAMEAERKQAEEALREQQNLIKTILAATPDLLVLKNRDSVYMAVNPAFCQFIGKQAEEIIGKTDFDLFPHAEAEIYSRDDARVMETRKPQVQDEEVTGSEAKKKWLQVAKTPVLNETGEAVGILCSVRDITERKQAEEALRESELRFRSMIEHTTDAVFCYEFDPPVPTDLPLEEQVKRMYASVLVECNEVCARAYGATRVEEVVGKTLTELFGTYPGSLDGLFTAMIEGGYRVVDGEGVEVLEDGTKRYYLNNGHGIVEDGKLVRVWGTYRDITERKEAEEALRESEERYRQLFEAESDAIFLIDNESGRILEANNAASVLYGYTREELLTKKNTDLSAEPEDTRKVTQETPVVMDQIVSIPLRYHRKKNGTVFPVEITGRFFAWRERPVHIAAIRDVTHRVHAEDERERLLAQIQEQAQRVQRILDTVPEGVILLDVDGQIILVNPVAERELIILADVRVGDSLTHLGDHPLADLLVSPPKGLWHELAAEGRSFQVIARPIEVGTTPGGWVMILRDVTRQREIQQWAQQQERLAALGQLAAGIAHDFNNIMASIVLYAQMTELIEGLPEIVREWMETINRQAGQATSLIQQILDFSRRSVLERQPLDLAPFLKEHVKLLERTLPESIEIKLDYEPGKYIINADPTRVQQMMTNMALNAQDAMRGGGELRIGLERIEIEPGKSPLLPEMAAGEWIRVTVSDTGAGIPPKVLPHIFEPFFTTRAPMGSGLGLAQVHGIVGQHRGRIGVDTQVGEGTTFTIYLPLHASEVPITASPNKLQALATGQGEVVLVVEDDAVVRKTLAESLELLNYRVLEAADGQEALEVLEQRGEQIALALCDVVMPRMGGIALLHALREKSLMVPVVLLTGHPLEREMEELRAQGMADWLAKPPQLEQLAKVVARALIP